MIRQSRSLETTDDKVYPGEKLLYMFYGRPSFRVNSTVQRTSASFFAPVCLIFDRTLLSSAHRIMPFDTGAHASGMLDGTIHKKMEKDRFALAVHPDSPIKLIRCFYGTEESYLENAPKASNVNIEDVQSQHKHYVEAYYHLVHHRSNTSLDERVNAVEVQFNREIPIDGNLQAVILPSRFYTNDVLSTIESDFNATSILYDMPASYNPTELMNTIYEKVRSFILTGASNKND